MTPQELKASILQLAIQGKLVEQNAADGNIDETLDVINKKREQLVKNGQLKKLGKINKTSDVVLEIPDSWRFVCLSEIISKRIDNRGKTPPHSLIRTDECCIDLLEINSIIPGGSIKHENVEKFIDEKTYATLRGYIEKDDILIATVGSIGKFAMMDDSKSAIAQNIIAIKCFEEIEQKYIFYLLQTPYFYASMGNITMEAVQASIKVPDLMNLRVPLPPLAEQKRIVAKIEELLPLIDRYEQAWSRLEDFNKRFPVDMQKSILQMAMQGRITEQLRSDGSARDLLKDLCIDKKITPAEPPFDIPENWLWIPIGNLGASTDTDSFSDGPFGSNLKTIHQISEPEVRIIQLSNIGEDGWKDKNVKYTSFAHLDTVIPRCKVHPGDFVVAKMMPAGRTIQVPDLGTRITLGSDAMKFVPNSILNKRYLLYAMRSQAFLGQVYAEAHGITRVRTTLNGVKSYVLPIPPLAEQKRIVAKLEEILPLCERLK